MSQSFNIIILAYLLITIIVMFFTPEIVTFMQQQPVYINETVCYIRLESIAIFISSVYVYLNSILIIKNKKKALCILLILQTTMTIVIDLFLVSEYSFSFKLGVYGIAVCNIIVNLILMIILLYFVQRSGIAIRLYYLIFSEHKWIRQWFQIGWKAGVESFIRNAVYTLMILQMINQVQQSGTYWLANQFIWSWLLLPVISLTWVIKQDAATGNGLSRRQVNRYLGLTAGIATLWLITAPTWPTVFKFVTDNQSVEPAINLVYYMIFFYIFFAFSNVVESYFYGIGRTDLILYKSLAINIIFYGSVFVLYKMNIFTLTFGRIVNLFGSGMIINAFITFLMYMIISNPKCKLSS